MGIVDEGITFTERFESIEAQLSGYYADAIEGTRKLSDDIQLIKLALGTLIAAGTGQVMVKGDIEKLIADLGFKPPSNLLVGVR